MAQFGAERKMTQVEAERNMTQVGAERRMTQVGAGRFSVLGLLISGCILGGVPPPEHL